MWFYFVLNSKKSAIKISTVIKSHRVVVLAFMSPVKHTNEDWPRIDVISVSRSRNSSSFKKRD